MSVESCHLTVICHKSQTIFRDGKLRRFGIFSYFKSKPSKIYFFLFCGLLSLVTVVTSSANVEIEINGLKSRLHFSLPPFCDSRSTKKIYLNFEMGLIKRGALIVIEGVDRSGKSTQCKNLVQSLEKMNIKSKLITFPDRTTSTGKLIDEYLRNKECNLSDEAIHLLFTANRWENLDKMKALLFEGVTLVVDRYSYSGIVFSAVKKSIVSNFIIFNHKSTFCFRYEYRMVSTT